MKRLLIILYALMLCSLAFAQNVEDVRNYGQVNQPQDSSFVVDHVTVDSTLVGKSIFEAMPSRAKGDRGNVQVNQAHAIRNAVNERANAPYEGSISGYRVRIYFANSQRAREESAAAAARFREKYGTYSVYHSFTSPNFKVTVGNFRTKSEALELLNLVKKDFPSAFVVKENITLGY